MCDLSTKQNLAAEFFDSGFNCAQSIFATFCEKYSLNQETAFRLACGLGGGFRSGEICGAVSGAVLVVGLKYGQYIAGDSAAKSQCYSKTVEFLDAFKVKNHSIVCREILGCDISTDEGRREAQNKNLFKTTCIDMIKSAVSILEELGY